MATSKKTPTKKVKYQGPAGSGSFVVHKTAGQSREDPTKAESLQIQVPEFAGMLWFCRQEQMPSFAARRIRATMDKFMNAAALSFVQGSTSNIVVGGARLQTGTGRSWWKKIAHGDKKGSRGYHAAHFGMGTLVIGSQSVAQHSREQLVRFAAQHGIAQQDIEQVFPTYCRLIQFGLAHDADTYYTLAMVNLAEGQLEAALHPYLSTVMPSAAVPSRDSEVPDYLKLIRGRTHWILDGGPPIIRQLENRLRQIELNPTGERLQHPGDNPMFDGKETNLLRAWLDLFSGQSAEYNGLSHRMEATIAESCEEHAEAAMAAVHEIQAVETSD